ncbi:MAG: cysteine--tRNA ligase [Deltaproteobacteria bacterium]|nr:cysteine--tRNA ligase [Deltaproteobacteria bacterium]
MTLYIYNTLSGKKEKFIPIKKNQVSMYVCGPTVYDSCHVGHARSVIVFDVIARHFKALGYNLKYIRNFTDIDDKIIKKAQETGSDAKSIAKKYIKEFYQDMDALNVKRADVEPKATDHIDEIIELINLLIEKKAAYEIEGDVYFEVKSFEDYGKLSGRNLEDMQAGARIDVDERKKNPFDFALWKSAKQDEPYWISPWGKGRPGWHIECSAMSRKYLGTSFDIHGGGKDLIFPHHENEIAQSEKAFGIGFVNYWIHNGFVNINKEKMSKSLGNFLTVKDMLKQYHPDSIRLFLLSNHYRSPIDFSDKNIKRAEAGIEKIYALTKRIADINIVSENKDTGKYFGLFCEAMNDDFNTAKGIGELFNAVKGLNKLLDKKEKSENIITIKNDIEKISNILGILSDEPSLFFEKKNYTGLKEKNIDAELIEKLISERNEARKLKKWAKSDKIRNKLSKMNIVLKDSAEETVWSFTK